MRTNAYRFFLLVVSFFIAIPFQVIAQNTPPGDQPGAQGSRFQIESQQKKKQAERKKAAATRITVEEKKEKQPAAQSPSFVLSNVKITGATFFTPDDLRPAYEAYIGTKVTFSDLENIAAAIKAGYKQKGYLSTDVYIPEQDIAQGSVEIRVLEGKMGDLKVEGNKWFSGPLLAKYIHVKKNELLNIFTLQKDMLRLNQSPDLEVTAVVSPGKDPASTDIVLKVKDSFPHHIGANLDNQGTRLVGKYRTSLALRSTNCLGVFDSLAVNTLVSADSSGEFVSYTFPIDTYGTRLGFDLTNFDMKLGREYRDLDITGRTQVYSPHISSEIYLSEAIQAYSDVGIDIKSVKRKTAGTVDTNDKLRMPYASVDISRMDAWLGGGQTVVSPRLSFNAGHFLGASTRKHPYASRPGTGGFFVKYEQTMKRFQRVSANTIVSANSRLQAASRTLPSSEQFQVGGANSVRGYPEGEYMADTGATLNAEWVLFVKQHIQPVLFLDIGAGNLKRTGEAERSNKFLMGAGAGVRFQWGRNFYMRLDWAKHLADRPRQGQGPSNFYITAQCEI
jgi:hemolysin activation/secretion protein